jgi:chromosome segregation ATPase
MPRGVYDRSKSKKRKSTKTGAWGKRLDAMVANRQASLLPPGQAKTATLKKMAKKQGRKVVKLKMVTDGDLRGGYVNKIYELKNQLDQQEEELKVLRKQSGKSNEELFSILNLKGQLDTMKNKAERLEHELQAAQYELKVAREHEAAVLASNEKEIDALNEEQAKLELQRNHLEVMNDSLNNSVRVLTAQRDAYRGLILDIVHNEA